jgi:hypothetical protein
MKQEILSLLLAGAAAMVMSTGCATEHHSTAYSYKVVSSTSPGGLQPAIQQAAADGWKVVSSGGDATPFAILSRPTRASGPLLEAQASLPGDTTIMFSGDVQGNQYISVVRSADATNAPRWSADRGNPPVAVGEAARLAAKGLAKTLGDLAGWSRGDITLHEWPGSGRGYWFYQIEFQGPTYTRSNTQFKSGSKLTVLVLMNGRVICPKPAKEQ